MNLDVVWAEITLAALVGRRALPRWR